MREAGAEDAVDSILGTFVTALPAYLDALVAAVAAKDGGDIQRGAHAFKSAAGSIGAQGLATLLADMETAARDGNGPPVGPALARVRVEADAVLSQLRVAGVP
jgi:HPt (histidine-containing phosphotransfer) domain-containing protein